MTLEEILKKIIDLDKDTWPCEVGIPCPFNQHTGYKYCIEGDCVEGMSALIRSVVEK